MLNVTILRSSGGTRWPSSPPGGAEQVGDRLNRRCVNCIAVTGAVSPEEQGSNGGPDGQRKPPPDPQIRRFDIEVVFIVNQTAPGV